MTRIVSLLFSALLLASSASAQAPGQLPPVEALPAPTAAPIAPPAPPLPGTPATSLPPVSVVAPAAASPAPTAAAPMPDATNTQPGAPAANQPPSAPVTPSIGKSTISLFFTPNQMRALRDALSSYENHHGEVGTSIEVATEAPKKIVEPATYPVFYLSSIVYHSPADWSIWVSGHKITSNKNTTSLQVIGVSADRAAFIWKPEYADALATRYANHLFADAQPVKNKMTTPQTFHYDEKTGSISFSLLTNQSFMAAYSGTFEGLLDSPPMPPLPVKAEEKAAATAPGTPISDDNALANKAVVNPDDQVLHQNEGLADDSINALINRIKH